LSKDKQLAEGVPEIDLILGGHSHSVLDTPIRENQTWICQGGSHARFVGVYDLAVRSKQLTGGLIPLP
jgi:5'-nucleotidase